MKKFWLSLTVSSLALAGLSGCNPITVLNPKGPQAEIQSDTIIFSIYVMAGILIIVYALFIFMIVKYRAKNQPIDYEPPYIKGNTWLEIIWTAIPIIIVIVLSVVTVKTTFQVESTPAGHEKDEPLVIYAASSNWKWHFSYPELDIETVNYVNIPTDRAVEFKLYSYGPITSFWIPSRSIISCSHLALSNKSNSNAKGQDLKCPGASQTNTLYLSLKNSICFSNSLWSAVRPGRNTSVISFGCSM